MSYSLLLAFGLYALVLLFIGIVASRYNRSSQDFHLGGRRINYWVTAISAHAGDMSSWLFLAFPFSVYANGLLESWAIFGLMLGMWANWQFIAPRLRALSETLKSETIPDFLSKSVKDSLGIIKFLSCFFCIFFFLFYIASGLKGIGFLLNHLFSLPFGVGIFLSAFIIIVYITLGGFFAISFVDAFQGIFLLCMLVLVPFAMVYDNSLDLVDFFSLALQSSTSDPHTKNFFQITGPIVALSWGLGYFGLPHVLSKFMGIDSVKNIKKSQYIGLVWQFFALFSSLAVGILARGYFQGESLTEDLLFIEIVRGVFNPFLAGLVFCAILAATISTVDSQIMVSATSLTKDVFKLSGKKSVLVSRLCIVAITLTASCVAYKSGGSIDQLVRYAWTGQGSSFGPLMIAVLYFRRVTMIQAAVAIVLGGGLSILWPLMELPLKAYPMVPAFFISLSYLFVSSHLLVKKS